MTTIATTPRRRRTNRRTLATGVVAALVLAGCGSSGGDDAEVAKPADAPTTTEVERTTTTATDASNDEEAEPADGLPTDEADAPSGDWISVRFLVATEPEPEDFNKGSSEARLWEIESDCSGGGACSLEITGGAEGGGFEMPDTEPIEGDPISLEADGDEWTGTYTYPDDVGCTEELDGPYIESTEQRTLGPVHDQDGNLTGLVGTVVFTDALTEEGRAAGCPASSEVTYAYALVAAPEEGLESIDEYSVEGTFRQTLEVTSATNQSNEMFQEGGISTTCPKYDADLSGLCEDGECSVSFAQLNGNDLVRRAELTSEDGRTLDGTYEDEGSCSDADGNVVFDSGAYDATGSFEGLTPIWVEGGEVKAFVGKYHRSVEPTALGMTDPSCSEPESFEAWVYLVDTDSLGS